MQRPNKNGPKRPANTGLVDATEFAYIKHLLAKSKGNQADVMRFVSRSSATLSYIARAESYSVYVSLRQSTVKKPTPSQNPLFGKKATPDRKVIVEMIPGTDIPAMGDVRVIPTVDELLAKNKSKDYSGALLGQTARLTSAITDLNMTIMSLRPILARVVDMESYQRPESSKALKAILKILFIAMVATGAYMIGTSIK